MSSSLSAAVKQSNKTVVIATYRHLLRATRIAFEGDNATLIASRRFARESFQASRRATIGSAEAVQAIEHAQGVTKILRENVVQGKQTNKGTYRLNIHEHTERGDNDTAGRLKGTSKTWKEVKNAAF